MARQTSRHIDDYTRKRQVVRQTYYESRIQTHRHREILFVIDLRRLLGIVFWMWPTRVRGGWVGLCRQSKGSLDGLTGGRRRAEHCSRINVFHNACFAQRPPQHSGPLARCGKTPSPWKRQTDCKERTLLSDWLNALNTQHTPTQHLYIDLFFPFNVDYNYV